MYVKLFITNGKFANIVLWNTNFSYFVYPVFHATFHLELRLWKENSQFICKSNKAVGLYDSVEELISFSLLFHYPYFHRNQSVYLPLGIEPNVRPALTKLQ
jgi:hypothetical protein